MVSGSAEVADVGVAGDAFEILEIAGFADEQAQLCAFSGESLGHVMADESGGACKKDFHSLESI